jgi:hypothetical protein
MHDTALASVSCGALGRGARDVCIANLGVVYGYIIKRGIPSRVFLGLGLGGLGLYLATECISIIAIFIVVVVITLPLRMRACVFGPFAHEMICLLAASLRGCTDTQTRRDRRGAPTSSIRRCVLLLYGLLLRPCGLAWHGMDGTILRAQGVI